MKFKLGLFSLAAACMMGALPASASVNENAVMVYGEACEKVAPDKAQVYGAIKIVSKEGAYDEALEIFESAKEKAKKMRI